MRDGSLYHAKGFLQQTTVTQRKGGSRVRGETDRPLLTYGKKGNEKRKWGRREKLSASNMNMGQRGKKRNELCEHRVSYVLEEIRNYTTKVIYFTEKGKDLSPGGV